MSHDFFGQYSDFPPGNGEGGGGGGGICVVRQLPGSLRVRCSGLTRLCGDRRAATLSEHWIASCHHAVRKCAV